MLSQNIIVIVAGATGSGKSRLATQIAQEINGVIINADSMQAYADLRLLTARPTAAEEAATPHKLYGVLAGTARGSAGWWLKEAERAIRETWGEGRVPLLVGGTGLYLEALRNGIAPVPDIPTHIMAEAEALRAEGSTKLYAALQAIDPIASARVPDHNPQRLMRAWAVMRHTGKSIVAWHEATYPTISSEAKVLSFVTEVERSTLYNWCDQRLEAMLKTGALAEVKQLLNQNYPPSAPIMKAIGVPEFSAHLAGNLALMEALITAQTRTRNYVKRQLTWFRHRLPEAARLPALPAQQADACAHVIAAIRNRES